MMSPYDQGKVIVGTVVTAFAAMILSLVIIGCNKGNYGIFICAVVMFAMSFGVLMYIYLKLREMQGYINYNAWTGEHK